MADEKTPLPPGWDMKFDSRTGKYYYINHYTKSTSWEDPRERYQQIGKAGNVRDESKVAVEQFQLQERGGRASSPIGGKTNPITPQMGFGQQHAGYTGMYGSPGPLARLQLETEPYESPGSQRSTLRRDSHILAEMAEMESSFTSQEQVEAPRATASAAVTESRDRYHGSQAVVMSALQVAKHPIAAPGPSAVYSPLTARHATLPGVSGVMSGFPITGSLPPNFPQPYSAVAGLGGSLDQSSGYPTPRPGTAASDLDTSLYMGSPQIGGTLFKSFPKPHSSPKMKLRYLKSVFPTVEEYLLLDVLANSENNVQKATDKLSKMGYVKRETPAAPRLHAKKKEEERLAEKRTPLPKPPPIKTDTEKDDLRKKMKDKYEKKYDIPERILFMALESVLYDEEQAVNLITTMIEDDIKRQKAKEAEKARERAEKKKSPKPVRKVLEAERPKPTSPKRVVRPSAAQVQGRRGFAKHPRAEQDQARTIRFDGVTAESDSKKEIECKTLAKGPDPSLRKGPNDDLLLTDYVTWNGPNPGLRKGPQTSKALGPSSKNYSGPGGLACGPNLALRRGPQALAKGSMYASISTDNSARSQ